MLANVDLTSPETLARTILEKAPAAGAARTPRQQQADRIRAEAVEKGPRSALETATKTAKIPSEADINSRIAENFYAGVTRNAAGGVDKQVHAPGSPEVARQDKILERAQTLRLILENGYDSLPAGAQKTEMLKFAADTVKGWPDAKSVYDSLPAATRDATFNGMVENMLRNSEMRKFLQNRFAGVMDKDRPFEQIKVELQEAEARALDRRDKIKDKILSNKIELLAINSDLDSFRQGVAGKGLELRNLNNELGTLNSSKSRYENFITNQDSLKSELIRSREVS